jgi:hypothetical protein
MTRLVFEVMAIPLVVTVPQWSERWAGTIAGHPVACRGEAVFFGAADVVDAARLWCRGTSRHAAFFVTRSTTVDGRLAFATAGTLCRRGPRPGHRHARTAGCCDLTLVDVAGTFSSPAGAFVPAGLPFVSVSGTVTALDAGLACRHRVFPAGTVALRRAP